MSLETLASALGITVDRLSAWENGTEPLSMPQLRRIADATKRPLPAFYLPQAPALTKVDNTAFRTIGSKNPENSPKRVFAERKAVQMRETAIDLAEQLGEEIKAVPVPPIDVTVEDLALEWRTLLDIDTLQKAAKGTREFFNLVRVRLESLGFIVLQFERMETEVVRGFVIPEQAFPVIGLSWSDAYSAKNFSLMHELAHVLFELSGREHASRERLEIDCNKFAGLLLVPSLDLRQVASYQREWNPAEVLILAKRFKVSLEVIARRLVDSGLAEKKTYASIRALNEAPYDKDKEKKGGALPRPTVAVSLLGRNLPSMILTGYAENLVGLREATEYLGLKPKHFDGLSKLLAKNA